MLTMFAFASAKLRPFFGTCKFFATFFAIFLKNNEKQWRAIAERARGKQSQRPDHTIYMSELRAYGFDPAHPKKRRLFS
ncbi:MAG: hypothetical protein K2K99_00705 [Muribaculaceae bacterium]|nr:hypothetical protein [Muribaculaceae bacterium]